MGKLISDLEDKSAAGIVKAADEGVLLDDVRYSEIIRQARELVAAGRGDVLYAGAYGRTPKWVKPPAEDEAPIEDETPGAGGPSDG